MSGPHETFFESGILFGHFHVDPVSRRAQGHAFWNYPSGLRLMEGSFKNGIRSGRWQEFAEDGTILQEFELGDGEYDKEAAVPKLEEITLSPETTILLQEEYGFRHWFWLPDRPIPALLDWWRGLLSVEPWFYSPEPLPDILILASGHEYSWWDLFRSGLYYSGHLHEDDDSELKSPSGEVIRHRGYNFVTRQPVG